MLFKVDENLHPDVAEFLRQNRHDATAVRDQGLRGHPDAEIATVCRREQRALMTLDLDFSDVRAYPPADHPGIVVLPLTNQSRPAVLKVVQRILALFTTQPLAGHLSIVDEAQVCLRGTSESP